MYEINKNEKKYKFIDIDRRFRWSDDIIFNINKNYYDMQLSFCLPKLSCNYKFINDICHKLIKTIKFYVTDIYYIQFMMCELDEEYIMNNMIINLYDSDNSDNRDSIVYINIDKITNNIKFNNMDCDRTHNGSMYNIIIKLNELNNIIIKNFDNYPMINLHPYDFKFKLSYHV